MVDSASVSGLQHSQCKKSFSVFIIQVVGVSGSGLHYPIYLPQIDNLQYDSSKLFLVDGGRKALLSLAEKSILHVENLHRWKDGEQTGRCWSN